MPEHRSIRSDGSQHRAHRRPGQLQRPRRRPPHQVDHEATPAGRGRRGEASRNESLKRAEHALDRQRRSRPDHGPSKRQSATVPQTLDDAMVDRGSGTVRPAACVVDRASLERNSRSGSPSRCALTRDFAVRLATVSGRCPAPLLVPHPVGRLAACIGPTASVRYLLVLTVLDRDEVQRSTISSTRSRQRVDGSTRTRRASRWPMPSAGRSPRDGCRRAGWGRYAAGHVPRSTSAYMRKQVRRAARLREPAARVTLRSAAAPLASVRLWPTCSPR